MRDFRTNGIYRAKSGRNNGLLGCNLIRTNTVIIETVVRSHINTLRLSYN